MESKACQQLEESVIKKGLCTLCGACVGLCPYLVAYKGRVLVRDACHLPEGRCATFCPRASLDLDELSRGIFGIPYSWDGIHRVLDIFMARPADAGLRDRAQDAGTVSALISLALEEGFIDSAVVTSFHDKSLPRVNAVSNAGQLAQSSRSNYMAVPVLEAFNRAASEPGRERIGVVATPCQVQGLSKMRLSGREQQERIGKLQLVIGLFCTWALSYPSFAEFLESEVPEPVVKYKIPPPPANVLQCFTAFGRIDVPLERIAPFIRPACRLCLDMTAEFADISVGAVEFAGPQRAEREREAPAWNTVIVRTDRGMSLIERARSKGIIKTERLPEEILDHLKHAAWNKKKRALKEIVARTGSKEDLLYVKAESSAIAPLIEES